MSASYDSIQFLTQVDYNQASSGAEDVIAGGNAVFFISKDQIPEGAEIHVFGQYTNDAAVVDPTIIRVRYLRIQDAAIFPYGFPLVEGVVESGSGYFSFRAPLPPLPDFGSLFITRQTKAHFSSSGLLRPGIRFVVPENPLTPSVSSGSVALTFQTYGTASIGPFAPSENFNSTFTPGIDWDALPGTHFRVKWTLDVDDLAGGNLELSLYNERNESPNPQVFFGKVVLSGTGKQTVEFGPFPRLQGYQRMITKYRSTTALSGSVISGTPIVEVLSFDA